MSEALTGTLSRVMELGQRLERLLGGLRQNQLRRLDIGAEEAADIDHCDGNLAVGRARAVAATLMASDCIVAAGRARLPRRRSKGRRDLNVTRLPSFYESRRAQITEGGPFCSVKMSRETGC